ncbi:MAG: hypothetical protein Q8L13_00325 [Bradyrhizobium sp.]|uniref:hypothetical protein n=1 Tax=Bradyrhizobium sp. TaxID=376 RepID=UPI00273114BF|nr:hypothetical protein [Bradyrhizobium sp.]MDP1864771.1 hypothetical protein [Bradyrhizobium sp.]
MMTRSTNALAVALLFLGTPVMAQGTSSKDSNAHHYQGGPKTSVPHLTEHPESNANANAKVRTKSGGHHYSGGPKSETHHMGEKK